LLDAGAIGRLWQVKWRGGSMGPLAHGSTHPGIDGVATEMTPAEKGATWWHQRAAGGGALLDYACYGACLARWYAGEPAQAVFGLAANINSPYGDADDNAVLTVRFPRALAILEATWTTVDHAVPTGPILYGETGTLVVERRRGQPDVVRLCRGGGREPEAIAAEPLPAGRATPAQELIHHLETGAPLHETLTVDFNLDAQALGLTATDPGRRQSCRSRSSSRRRLLRSTSTVLPSWPKTPTGSVMTPLKVDSTSSTMTASAKVRFWMTTRRVRRLSSMT
jgi:predicted dehydrogenase